MSTRFPQSTPFAASADIDTQLYFIIRVPHVISEYVVGIFFTLRVFSISMVFIVEFFWGGGMIFNSNGGYFLWDFTQGIVSGKSCWKKRRKMMGFFLRERSENVLLNVTYG